MIENILLTLLVVLLCAKVVGSLFQKIGLDSSIGELFTGIVFGGSVLNLVSAKSIESFAVIGSVLILFVAGMKQQDIEEIYKDKAAIKIGLTLLIVTGALMSVFFYYVPRYFGSDLTLVQSIILGLAFSIIDIGVPAKVLVSKGLIYLPVGRIVIRSAIINIIAGLFLFTLVTMVIGGNALDIAFKGIGIFLFTIITVCLLLFLSRISKFVMRFNVDEAEFSLAIVLVLGLAYFSDLIGFSNVLGAFIAGVFVSKMPFAQMRSFSDKIKAISFGLFVPLFFVWFGLEINLSEIWLQLGLALLIFVTYVVIRFVITYLYMRKYELKMPALISASMLSVDVESLVILVVAIQLGIFTTNAPLTLFAPSVFLSTLLIVILVAVFSKIEKGRLQRGGTYAFEVKRSSQKRSIENEK